MKNVKVLLMTAAVALASSSVSAQSTSDKWLVGVGTHAVNQTSVRGAEGFFKKDNWSFATPISSLTIARSLNKSFAVDLVASLGEIDNNRLNISDEFFVNAGLGLRYKLTNDYILAENSRFDPYLRVGANYHKYNYAGAPLGTNGAYTFYADGVQTNSTQETDYIGVAAGLGFNLWFNKNRSVGLNLGADYNFMPAAHRDYMDFIQANAGLVFRFGATDTDKDGIIDKEDKCPEVAGLKQFQGCPDSDLDGIQDSEDKCPEIAGLAELNGCPDTDKDGIADNDDKCPNVAGTKANNGCPDTDNDGVIDSADKCPTVKGPKANAGCPWPDTDNDGLTDNVDRCPTVKGPKSNKGCPITGDVLNNDDSGLNGARVYFNTGKTSIQAVSQTTLDRVYNYLSKHPDANWRVEGHTDSVGRASSNKRLSQGRAQAVADYLVSKGMSASKLRAVGFGEEKPLESNATKAGRSKNRRVEIYSESK